MKTQKELLTGKKSTYKIVNDRGETVAKGFINQTCASQMLPGYKLNKREKLRIIEDE